MAITYLEVSEPLGNAFVRAGQPFLVTGRVDTQWLSLAEPILIDAVTVQIGSEPPVDAEVTTTKSHNTAVSIFTTTVEASGFMAPGPLTLTVVATDDSGESGMTTVQVVCDVDHHQWYVSPGLNSAGDGSPGKPWSLTHAAGATDHVQPGDTVWLEGGTYASETGYIFSVSGNATDKITFRPYPGQTVILDGSIAPFNVVGNSAWEPYEVLTPVHNVYRSGLPLPASGTPDYGGFISISGEWYSLAPHQSPKYLRSDIHNWWTNGDGSASPRYLGPGVSQDEHGYVYIRLDNSDPQAQLGRAVTQINDPDPRHHAIYLCNSNNYGVTIRGSHLVLKDLQINNFNGCFFAGTPQTDIMISGCSGRPAFTSGRFGPVDGLTLRSCSFHAHMDSNRWWVAYSDMKGPESPPGVEPPGAYARKLGLGFGKPSNVEVVDCLLEEFFDGILGEAPHDVEVHDTTFSHIWDDAWQMYGNLYHVNFHDNICYGAGPSVDHTGTKEPNPDPGTIYIHHNVIDTTTRFLFWARLGSKEAGVKEPIPMSTHGWPTQHTIPRKLYYNTIRTRSAGASNVGWALFGATTATNEATHEVYNNIFVSFDGRPGGRDFYGYSGREIYDGNVYFDYQVTTPWTLLHYLDSKKMDRTLKDVITVQQLRMTQVVAESKKYYPRGWESVGLSIDPSLDELYRPLASECQTGAVNLTDKCWPGTKGYEEWRGARRPPP